MAQPFTIHSQYAGMARDMSRDQLPPGFVWNLQDFFPNALGAPLRKRGGWIYGSSAMGSTTSISRIAVGPTQNSGYAMFAIDSATSTSAGPTVYRIDSTGAVTAVGSVTAGSAGSTPSNNGFFLGNPVMFDNLMVVPIGSETTGGTWATPITVDGTNIGHVTGISAGDPGWKYATVYKDRVVLGASKANRKRIRFSAAGAADNFDDTTSWIGTNYPVTGLASLPNVLLVFSLEATSRIRGSTPPPGSDMILDKLSDYGCADQRSIITWNGKCVYADTNGVYITDGINTANLTEAGYIDLYYQDLLSNYTSSWELNAGVFRDYYFLCITDSPGGTLQDCLVCDLRKRSWFRFQNFNFRGFVEAKSTVSGWYAAIGDTNRLAKLNSVFSPAASNKADADGDNVLPVVEYPAVRGFRQLRRKWVLQQGLTHWKRIYSEYDLRDAGSDNPTLTLSYVTTPAATSYTAITPTLAETSDSKRAARSFGPSGARGGKIVPTMAVKIAQTGPSSDTRIYALQGEYEAVEESRLAQS